MQRDIGFDAFARQRTAALYRAALLLCDDHGLAEDLVQETLAKVYVAWGRRGIDNPAAYAHATLVRVFVSARRRRSFFERPAATVPEQVAPNGETGLDVDLVGALSALGRVDRAVIVLRFLEDRSVEETASLLDLTPGAVRNRTLRSLRRIRALLGPENHCRGGRP